MTRTMLHLFRLLIGTVLGAAALLWSGQLPQDPHASLVSSAQARVGRPLTPMSYAGVARRTLGCLPRSNRRIIRTGSGLEPLQRGRPRGGSCIEPVSELSARVRTRRRG